MEGRSPPPSYVSAAPRSIRSKGGTRKRAVAPYDGAHRVLVLSSSRVSRSASGTRCLVVVRHIPPVQRERRRRDGSAISSSSSFDRHHVVVVRDVRVVERLRSAQAQDGVVRTRARISF